MIDEKDIEQIATIEAAQTIIYGKMKQAANEVIDWLARLYPCEDCELDPEMCNVECETGMD